MRYTGRAVVMLNSGENQQQWLNCQFGFVVDKFVFFVFVIVVFCAVCPRKEVSCQPLK